MSNNAYINDSCKIQRMEVTSLSTNPTVIFQGKALLKNIYVVNTNSASVFVVKVYDKATLPDENDTPVLTWEFTTFTGGLFSSSNLRRNTDIFFENGISIRTTNSGSGFDDNSTSPAIVASGTEWIYVMYKEV